ncbi:NAD-dependent epimerase/dehydratase family protein [Chloroflexota bacterium]
MTEKRTILVTAVSGYWGSRVAGRLGALEDCHVIGIDVQAPLEESANVDFIQADIRNPLIGELLRAEAVDTVCHLAFVDRVGLSETAFDVNLMGTMKLCGACAEVGIRKIVLKSSTAVYGARPTNPAFLSEQHALRGSRRYGYTRDMVEIEAFCSGFRRQVPDLMLTILRFPSIVGPAADTPMTRFLRQRYSPTLMGFDPMMQVIHEEDVVAALVHAVAHDAPGVFNVAALDPLPLSRVRGLAGKPLLPVFHPFVYAAVGLLGRARLEPSRCAPMDPDYLRYTWVADLSKMQQELGFEPAHTAPETLREFGERERGGGGPPDALNSDYGEEHLRAVMEERSQIHDEQQINEPTVVAEGEEHD